MKAAARKTLIAIAGGLVLLAGIAMLVLPGPAFLVIPAGLAILATEFHWARVCTGWAKEKCDRGRERFRRRRRSMTTTAPEL